MNKGILIFCICILASNVTFSQKQNFPNGPIVNFKAGYHFAENKSGTPTPYDNSIPAGPTFEISGEMPTGKGWYPGIGFEYSAGSGMVNDVTTGAQSNRSVYITNISAYIKKRLLIERSAVYFVFGLGRGLVTENYDSQFTDNEDGVLSLTLKIGGEYAVASQLLLSVEAQYLGLGEPFANATRSNTVFMVKGGIGYVFK